MKGILLFIAIITVFSLPVTAQNSEKLSYINRYKDIAISEMKRAGIPASIKLAQGILESNAGRSELAREAHNHFGIKCAKNWTGPTFHKEDDDYDDQGTLIKSCFRKYKNPEASYIAHSEFLRDPAKVNRYGFLFRLNATDYRSWANGLRVAGYATNPNYPALLINIIEDYQLNQYDVMDVKDIETKTNRQGVRYINHTKVTFSKESATPQDIANQFEIPLYKLYKWNERLSSPEKPLEDNTPVFLQRKRISYRGKQKYHYVKELENMYLISQLYGIRLDKLYDRNNLVPNAQPAVGERLQLRGFNRSKTPPALRGANPADTLQTTKPPTTKPPATPGNATTSTGPSGGDVFLDIEITPGGVVSQTNPAPGSSTNPTKPTGSTNLPDDNEPPPGTAVYYEVIKGDTLYNISRRYNTTVAAIKSLNNLTADTISIGQKLRVK